MNFCVLVKISKHKVTFWYQSEKSQYAPLIIKETNEVPLYFYVNCNDFIFGDNIARDKYNSSDPNAYGNYFEIIKDPSKHFFISGNKKPVKQLLYYGIEKYLSHFLNTVLYKSDSIESYRQFFPLRILYEADIEDKEKIFIESIFLEAGYDNVERINLNESLFEVLSLNGVIDSNLSVLLLNGIENTLYIDLFNTKSGDLIGSSKIEGQGADPRVKILAEMIVEDIIELNSYLYINKEIEIAAILPYAAELLENDTPIIKGRANLTDGKNYSFEVKRNMLDQRLLYHSNESLYKAIDELLKFNCIKVKETIILLASKEINTSYLSKKLLGKYPYVKGIEPLHIIETMKLVFSKIANSGYTTKKNEISSIHKHEDDKKVSILEPPRDINLEQTNKIKPILCPPIIEKNHIIPPPLPPPPPPRVPILKPKGIPPPPPPPTKSKNKPLPPPPPPPPRK